MQQLIDPYRALGVARGATEVEIKAAHRKLVKRYHPDAGSQSETEHFLRVQEAYRVLSDPLLRKEWDQKHAPGPVRADRPAASPPRRRRPPAPRPEAEPSETAPPPRQADAKRSADPRTQPRSARSYTWSASEVPWWEEARADKGQVNSKSGAKSGKKRSQGSGNAAKGAAPPDAAPSNDGPVFNQQDFDVYNRSSGAAWSMAARAYFRKGEADLPRRGSFRHQGTQVVTAGRARAAAEAEARHRAAAAAAAMADVYATSQAVPHAPGPHEGTTHIVRRSLAVRWPSLGQRLIYALVAWLPIAALISLTFADDINLPVATALLGVSLVLLVAVPRVAYIAAVATVLVLIVGGLFVGGLLLAGRLPPVSGLTGFTGGLLVVGYLATAAVTVIGPSSLRPWSAQ